MVSPRAPPFSALIEPGAPLWAQRMVLKMLDYFVPQAQRAPMALWASTKANLPPAADWPMAICIVSDTNELALSLGGVWLKIVTGGPV